MSPAAGSHTCTRCGRNAEPRDGVAPTYCATCGNRLATAPAPPAIPDAGAVRSAGRTSGLAIASMIVGLLAVGTCIQPCFGFPCAIVALVLGLNARRDIQRSAGRLSGLGWANAGITLGAIELGLIALMCAGFTGIAAL